MATTWAYFPYLAAIKNGYPEILRRYVFSAEFCKVIIVNLNKTYIIVIKPIKFLVDAVPDFRCSWFTTTAFSHFPNKFIERHIYLFSHLLNDAAHIVPYRMCLHRQFEKSAKCGKKLRNNFLIKLYFESKLKFD